MPRGKSEARRPTSIDVQVGANIRRRRQLVGMSQERLAAALGMTFQQVQKYERGTNRLSASRLYQIAKILRCSIEQLFENTDAPPAAPEDPEHRRTVDHLRIYRELPPHYRQAVHNLARTLARSEATEAAA